MITATWRNDSNNDDCITKLLRRCDDNIDDDFTNDNDADIKMRMMTLCKKI
jgi:hypothetical protein